MARFVRPVWRFTFTFISMSLFLTIFYGTMLWVPKAKRTQLALRFFHRWANLVRHVLRIQVQIEGRLSEEPVVIVANHRSYLDIILLAALKPVTFLAKKEVANWPLIGFAARLAGVIFVDRASPTSRANALVQIASRLAQGISVVVFPEGTTSLGPDIKPFRPGIFRLCQEHGFTLVPVAIHYDDARYSFVGQDAFVSHFFRTQWAAAISVHLWVGKPLFPKAENLREEAEHFVSRSIRNRFL